MQTRISSAAELNGFMKLEDLSDKKFGRLKVIRLSNKINLRKRKYWLCRCDCGETREVLPSSLKSGGTRSCGCIVKDFISKLRFTHGFRNTRFYSIFVNLKKRCSNPKSINYPRYGGRGIKCLWTSFEEFRDDMYESYLEHVKKHGEKHTTINRVDNDGNYCKENCRWATSKEQAKNRNNDYLIESLKKTPSWKNKK